jgi:hypothetical protein
MRETWVSRILHPRDLGVDDPPECGLILGSHFLDALPPGAFVEH